MADPAPDPIRLVETGAVDPTTPGARMATRHPRWFRAGRSLDRFLNVALLNGDDTETMSRNAALRARDGARWACVLCKVLHVIVEPHHCRKTLDPGQIEMPAALRAGAALLLLTILLLAPLHLLLRALF